MDLRYDTLSISHELSDIQSNTRRLAVWSVVAHLALGVFLLAGADRVPEQADLEDFELTQVTWLEDLEPAELEETPLKPAPAEEPLEETVVSTEAAPQPEPEVVPPARDQLVAMQESLARLRADDAGRREITSAAAPTLRRPDPASLGAMVPRQVVPAQRLNRAAPRPTAAPAPLNKGGSGLAEAAVRPTSGHGAGLSPVALREVLPGISLGGEVSGRKLINTVKPGYPEWAKQDGVEVTVLLYFTVLPDGRVKENILIERTSGFADFDGQARAALRQWRFERLPPGSGEQQWGRIEFNYQLRTTG